MHEIKNIELPDIGDFDEIEIIEILVNVGDILNKEDSIITLESDKASMEIPTPYAGVVASININVGDKVKQGDIILAIKNISNDAQNTHNLNKKDTPEQDAKTQVVPVVVPDIGDFDEIEVIEILVNVNDTLNKEDSIITLESDKSSMEIPTPIAGVVTKIAISLGDKVSVNDLILEITSTDTNTPKSTTIDTTSKILEKTFIPSTSNLPKSDSHASPSIRKLARELGVDLSNVVGTGIKNRILETDLKNHVKQIITTGSALPKLPVIDFSKFGKTETLALSKINKISSKHLSACWLNIPHVTQFDEVNIEKMERFRQAKKAKGIKLTPLVFIIKAVTQALKQHPRFNASLNKEGNTLILKKYFNLGIAMDTLNGLVVPVIRNTDKKSLTDLAKELAQTSSNARNTKLKLDNMQGAGFTISSLGGIGGTQFTPIVNAPEVAILGVSRATTKPIWNGKKFIPTLTLPLALSYDHRVIDGAQGGKFMADLNLILQNITTNLL